MARNRTITSLGQMFPGLSHGSIAPTPPNPAVPPEGSQPGGGGGAGQSILWDWDKYREREKQLEKEDDAVLKAIQHEDDEVLIQLDD